MTSSCVKSPSLWGGVLLVVGNVIGAGILALPIAMAEVGLVNALCILLFFCLLLLMGAFYFLEANVALPEGSNLISMAHRAFGIPGALIVCACNLLVMYSLIAAYISGGGDLISTNLAHFGFQLSSKLSAVFFILFLGGLVTLGMTRIDYANRFLMFFKGLTFFLIIFGLFPHLQFSHTNPITHVPSSLVIIVVTSYGFSTIVPSLRTYYHTDLKRIKWVMFLGMGIALSCYLIWVTVIFSVLPFQGKYDLLNMTTSPNPVSDLQHALQHALPIPWITQAFNIFENICIMTSFLANSISLTDFISDGIGACHKRRKSALVYFLAYTPPLIAVLFYPRMFLLGLSVAGHIAIILLLILPTIMVMRFRFCASAQQSIYTTFKQQWLVILVFMVSIFLLIGSLGGWYHA